MKLELLCLLVLAVVAAGCNMPPSNGRGDDCGPTRGPLSATSQDLDKPLAKNQSKSDVFNPSRW